MDGAEPEFLPGEDLVRVDPGLHGKVKPRFSHTEMKVLLEAIKRNRYILLRRFNNGVSAETKKNTWCEITAQINSLGENQREVRQIMKKWADLKFDAKRRMRGPNKKNFRKKNLGPIEKAVHKLLSLNPSAGGNGESDIDLDEDPLFSRISLPDSAYSDCFTPERSSLDRSEGDWDLESPDYGLDLEEEDDDDEDHLSMLESDEFYRSKPTYTYSRQERGPAQPRPRSASSPSSSSAAMAACVRQQQAGRELLASVARSVRSLAQSLQTMREKQQEFVRESLTLQRQTVETLRDFSNTALTMLQGAPQSSVSSTALTILQGAPQSNVSSSLQTRLQASQQSNMSHTLQARLQGSPQTNMSNMRFATEGNSNMRYLYK